LDSTLGAKGKTFVRGLTGVNDATAAIMVKAIFERNPDGTSGPIKVRMSYRPCAKSKA